MRAILALAIVLLLAGCTREGDPPGGSTTTPSAPGGVDATPPPTPPSEEPTPETTPATASPTATPPSWDERTLYQHTFNFLSQSASGRFEHAFEVPEGSRDLDFAVTFRQGDVPTPEVGVPTVTLVDPSGTSRGACSSHTTPSCDGVYEPIPAPEAGRWVVRYEGSGGFEADVTAAARVPP